MTYDFREARILDMTREKALDLLGFPASANPTEQELKKAQREKALAAHPDRGGSVAQMQDINRAFDFLKNAPKRPLEHGPSSGGYSGYAERQQQEWSREQQKRPDPVTFTFEQAKAQANVPSDAEWQFVTEWQRSPNNFFGDESMASKSAFVAYGIKDEKAIFVAVVYNQRQYATGSAMADLDVWGVWVFQHAVKDPLKETLNPAWLTAQVVKAIKFPRGEFEFDGKFNNKVRDAKDWKFHSLPPKENSVSIKQWLINSGKVDAPAKGGKPRKHVVELKMQRNPFEQKPGFYEHPTSKGNYYQLTVVVDGKDYILDKADTEGFLKLRLAGKGALEAIYGEYYYGGEKKNLTRMPKGKGLFFVGWLASNAKSLPDDARGFLEEAKQQLS